MKELLTASPILSGEQTHQIHQNPLTVNVGYDQPPNQGHQPIFEDCRSKWHSTGHMDFNQTQTPVPLRSSMQGTANITNNPMCSEYASVDIQNIGHYRTLQPPMPPPAGLVSPAPVGGNTQGSYNLGHYFPRVSSEPPSRKSYQTTTRNGDPLKVRKKYLLVHSQSKLSESSLIEIFL